MSMFVDSHCHLEMEEYDGDRRAVIDRATGDGVSCMLTVGTEARYFPKVIEIIETNPGIYGGVGIHPHNAKDYSGETEEAIRACLGHPKIVGYGEIGLDFYRDHSPREVQLRVFQRQIEARGRCRASPHRPLEERQEGDPRNTQRDAPRRL